MRLSAETKEQRQAKLETERDSGIDEDNRHLRQRQHLHAQGRQRNESVDWIITENRFQHSFNFELVQDRDRKLPQFSSILANDFNGGTATSWITRIKTEYFFDDKDRSRRQTNGKSKRSAGCTFVANSRVRSLQHGVFQPIFLQTLHAIGKILTLTGKIYIRTKTMLLSRKHSMAVSTVMAPFKQVPCMIF